MVKYRKPQEQSEIVGEGALVKVESSCKLMLLCNGAQASTLLKTMERFRQACDWLSQKAFDSGARGNRNLRDLWYRELRDRFGLLSQMADSACREVASKYKAWDKKKAERDAAIAKWEQEQKGDSSRGVAGRKRRRKRPKAMSRPRFKRPQLRLSRDRDWSFAHGVDGGLLLSLGTLGGRVKVAFEDRGMEQWFCDQVRFGEARVVSDENGRLWLHIAATVEVPDTAFEDATGVVGVDVGMRFLWWAAYPDGSNAHWSGKELTSKRAKYKRVRKSLQRKGTPSARRRLKSIGKRENRWAQDVSHRAAKALAESVPEGCVVALEDLKGLKKQAERVRKGSRYYRVSWPYADLQDKVGHKLKKRGIKVVKVNSRNTSTTCPKCGYRHKSVRHKADHELACPVCGHRSNDDLAAARNIQQRGMRYVAGAVRKGWEKQARTAESSGA